MARKPRRSGQATEHRMHKTLEEVAEFEDFRDTVLKEIRIMLKKGKDAAEIRAFVQALLTARQATIALTSDDLGVALKAINDLTHQNEGKPTERTETTHKFEKLKDEELDSLILSRFSETSADEEDTKKTIQ
jgi:DNA-binding transcriptional MerR regulator